MTITYFIYVILYIIMMVLIFSLSGIMLCPRTRVIFKAPVPHIHETVGKLLIPWGMTYIIFLPDIYFTINGVPWRDHAYVVVSMLTLVICISTSSWMYMSYLQQGVRQRVLQPFIIIPITVLTLWYAIAPKEWLAHLFTYMCLVEMLLIVGYYFKLYLGFIRDLKSNYSSFSISMFHGIWMQWAASILSFIVFSFAMVYDNVVWNIADIFANLFSLFVLVYTSERLVPLPSKESDVKEVLETVQYEKFDISKALRDNCERTLLFCNPELSLADLALALGTNRTYLGQWFADHDTNFYNYINGLRIEYAASLFRSSADNVSQVQRKSGFTSKTTFRKYFLERYGCTPSEYRRA